MIELYHHKEIDMLKLGCILPNLANICLINQQIKSFTFLLKATKTCWRRFVKIWLVVAPLSLHAKFYPRVSKFVQVNCRHRRKPTHHYSMCQPMPTGLYTRWIYGTESQEFMPRQNKTRSFENMVLSYCQQTRPECNIESNVTTGRQKKIDCFSVDGYCNYCNTVFEAMGCYFHYCPCQEARPSLTDNEITRGIKKGNKTKFAKNISNRKDTKLLKCASAIGGNYTE